MSPYFFNGVGGGGREHIKKPLTSDPDKFNTGTLRKLEVGKTDLRSKKAFL